MYNRLCDRSLDESHICTTGHIRLGIGYPVNKDMARAKKSPEKMSYLYNMIAQGDL